MTDQPFPVLKTPRLVLRQARPEDAPLLAMEVVSQDSARTDYRYKRSEYAVAEIGEYWIVDPADSKITLLRLEDGLYESHEYYGADNIVSRVFPELNIRVAQILNAGGAV